MKQLYKCSVCETPFERWSSQVTSPNPCCSRKCYGKQLTGNRNPNFGHKWTDDKKELQSKLIKDKMMTPNIRWLVGGANRGKKFDKERIHKMHGNRNKQSYLHPHSDETKRRIGKLSKEKFTQKYKDTHRLKMESLGYWIPLSEKTNWQVYQKEANWNGMLTDYFSETDWTIFGQRGMFHAKNNSDGLVRDHKLSRKTGFREGIFPELLRHPTNCQLIAHADNVSKAQTNKRDRDDISIFELINSIEMYGGQWKEQKLCIQRINEFKQGHRWSRQNSIQMK